MLSGFKSSKTVGRKRLTVYARQAPLMDFLPARAPGNLAPGDRVKRKWILGKLNSRTLQAFVKRQVDAQLEDRLRELIVVSVDDFDALGDLPGGAHDPGLQSLLQARTEELLKMTPAFQEHFEANAALRARFVERTELWSAAKVADFSASTAVNRHALASRWATEKRIFSVLGQKSLLYPAFQIDRETKRPYKEIKSILTSLDPDYEGWSLAIWFVTPNEWLDGAEPLSIWPDARARVAAAAQEEHALFHA